ncbi:MAG TPA: methyltransferase domain-containing protein [Actinocrinis sp.]|nr:methyltransferase domain-containing protein [Actinocrinis sp.]
MGPDEKDRQRAGELDWGIGKYETTAAALAPAAAQLVQAAAVQPGEQVLDLGCGTGNAALLAALPGVRVTGVDPAPRLLEVARGRAAAEGKEISFAEGRAESIPAAAGTFDVVLSVFAVIFADPAAATAELARVLAPGGRVVLSAWIPTGAVFEINACAGDAVRQVFGAPPPPAPFAWHDQDALSDLFASSGLRLESHTRHTLTQTAPSAESYLAVNMADHPMAVSGMAVLEKAGRVDEVRAQLLKILQSHNESPDALRITSEYVIATARLA